MSRYLLFDLDGTLTESGEGSSALSSMLWRKWESQRRMFKSFDPSSGRP